MKTKKMKEVKIKPRFYSEEEYNKLKAERDNLEAENAKLKIEINSLQLKISLLQNEINFLLSKDSVIIQPAPFLNPLNPLSPYISCSTNPWTNP